MKSRPSAETVTDREEPRQPSSTAPVKPQEPLDYSTIELEAYSDALKRLNTERKAREAQAKRGSKAEK